MLSCANAQISYNVDFNVIDDSVYNQPIKFADKIIIGATPRKLVEVDRHYKIYEGVRTFQKRLKVEGAVDGCYILIKAEDGDVISIYAMNASNKVGNRTLSVFKNNLKNVICENFIISNGFNIVKRTYTRHGAPCNLIFASSDGCFNFYAIEIET